jgi:hypothetical protein
MRLRLLMANFLKKIDVQHSLIAEHSAEKGELNFDGRAIYLLEFGSADGFTNLTGVPAGFFTHSASDSGKELIGVIFMSR